MKMVGRQLKEKSVKARLQVFKVLKEVAVALPRHVVQYVEQFVYPITQALKVRFPQTLSFKHVQRKRPVLLRSSKSEFCLF